MTLSNKLWALTATGMLIAGSVAVAPATHAATYPSDILCLSTSPVSDLCNLNANGQASTFSAVTWFWNGNTRTNPSVVVQCPAQPGDWVDISVNFVDASGTPQSEAETFFCLRNR